MKNKDLIKKLQEFDPELEVTITDGWQDVGYHTTGMEIREIKNLAGENVLDIDVGGLHI